MMTLVTSCGLFTMPQILGMMVELEDEEGWSLGDDEDDDEADSNAVAGESGLDRLACALGGKSMLPHILSNVPSMLQVGAGYTHYGWCCCRCASMCDVLLCLQNPDWKHRQQHKPQ